MLSSCVSLCSQLAKTGQKSPKFRDLSMPTNFRFLQTLDYCDKESQNRFIYMCLKENQAFFFKMGDTVLRIQEPKCWAKKKKHLLCKTWGSQGDFDPIRLDGSRSLRPLLLFAGRKNIDALHTVKQCNARFQILSIYFEIL